MKIILQFVSGFLEQENHDVEAKAVEEPEKPVQNKEGILRCHCKKQIKVQPVFNFNLGLRFRGFERFTNLDCPWS